MMQFSFFRRRNARPARRLGDLLHDRRGIAAIVLGLLALPLVGIIGLAIDYGMSTRAQALLNAAADSAAVAATDAAANAYVNNVTNISGPAQAAGQQVFNAQLINLPHITLQSLNVTVTQQPNSAVFVSTVAYQANYATFFGTIFGVGIFPIGGGSTAQITMRAYQDFHILMDFSGSMGIADNATDMASLATYTLNASNDAYNGRNPRYGTTAYNTNTNGQNSFLGRGSGNSCTGGCGAAQSNTTGCAFGCHWDKSNTNCNNCDFYEIAKTQNVSLRQDVMQAAVADVLGTLQTQDVYSQYRAAVYAFYTRFTTSNNVTSIAGNLTQLHALPAAGTGSSDLTTAASSAANAAMPLSGTDNATASSYWTNYPEPNTNFGAAMTALSSTAANGQMSCPGTGGQYIPCPGDGGTNTTPQEFLFVITDGIEDFCTSVSGLATCNNRTIRAIQPSECAALKAQGVQILVLYVQYVPLDTGSYYNSFYVQNVQQYVDPNYNTANGVVLSNLQSCASSPSFFFYASGTSDIEAQLNAMLLAAESQGVRIVR